ncbi:hypothetical protein CF5_0160 [Staphylococcus phage CF5]|uniref:Uncharacterized protein n=1 Tax=Staphylococcus phage CF5 TaxID=3113739 RepID=A0AAX4J6V9_9CAUD|nr:hypothetical protein CF5_0160 [Staphylococcus phage CF5]
MSFKEHLNKMRKEENNVVSPVYKSEKDLDRGQYTLDELLNNLLDKEGLDNVVSKFKPSTDIVDNKKVYACPITQEVLEDLSKGTDKEITIKAGQYFGVSTGLLSESENFQHLEGQMPRALFEQAHVMKPIFMISNDSLDYEQSDLIQDLKDGNKIEPVDTDNLRLVSSEEVDYLEVVNKSYIEDKINNVLENYHEVSSPDTLLTYYTKIRDSIDNRQMIYCPLLDKSIKTFE